MIMSLPPRLYGYMLFLNPSASFFFYSNQQCTEYAASDASTWCSRTDWTILLQNIPMERLISLSVIPSVILHNDIGDGDRCPLSDFLIRSRTYIIICPRYKRRGTSLTPAFFFSFSLIYFCFFQGALTTGGIMGRSYISSSFFLLFPPFMCLFPLFNFLEYI